MTSDPAPGTAEQPTDPEDTKIITLAAQARARTQAAQGAALRDTDGRTYAGSSVATAHLTLSAVQVVVAMAVSSGAQGAEAVAIAGEEHDSADDRLILTDLDCPVVWHATGRGEPLGAVRL